MLSERKLPPEREKYHFCTSSPWKQAGNARRDLWATFGKHCWVCKPWILEPLVDETNLNPGNFQQ
eukprot:7691197-Heterocapsa_arctica.AAC.1